MGSKQNMREIKFRAWDTRFNDMHYYAEIHQWNLNMPDLEEVTLMQYTGLKDKNGKEIYFGDQVVKAGDERIYEVVADYNGGALPFHKDQLSSAKNDCSIDWLPVKMPEGVCEHWVVVGNIYENKELLTN